ncbi:MAG: TetR/AcrR family transcriptional regulator [Pseudomonadota bacterium]
MAGQKKTEARRGQILKAAERVFAEKGFQEATVSDVAREAGVSDATIYEYFPSKEELLFSIPGDTTRLSTEMLSFHLNYVRGAANKIRSIVYHYLSFYQHHLDYASVIMLILKQNRKFLETEAYQVVRQGYRLIIQVIEEGVESGEFKPDIDPYLVRSVILGTIEHMVIRKVLLGRNENPLDAVDQLTDLIIEGIRRDEGVRQFNLRVTLEPAASLKAEKKLDNKI